jgi:hypothetical protein
MHNIKQTENALRIELNPPDGIVDFDAVAFAYPSLTSSQRPHPLRRNPTSWDLEAWRAKNAITAWP